MQITYNKPKNNSLILTIGNFDGVHLGHRHIINLAVDKAKASGCDSALLTFKPHPINVLTQKKVAKLSSWQQRKDIFLELGLNRILVQKFSIDFANLEYTTFIKNLVKRFDIAEIIIGQDFRCGANNSGNPEKLARLGKKHGYKLTAVPGLEVEGRDISSTYIRKLIKNGDLKAAKKLLAQSYKIECKVVSGDQRGRTLGFPTANLAPLTNYALPKNGVYAARLKLDEEYHNGIVNIGNRPTFAKDELAIEMYIFDFKQSIYDKKVELELLSFIRKEKNFKYKEQLVLAIEKDIKQAKKILE